MQHEAAETPAPQPDDDRGPDQRAALEQSLTDTHAAISEARTRLAEREASLKEALRDELLESRRRLEAMDREHDARVASIRAEADAAIDAILRGASEERP